MGVDLLRQQQRWKDGLQDLRTGFATLESQVIMILLVCSNTVSVCRAARFAGNDAPHKLMSESAVWVNFILFLGTQHAPTIFP